jgi:HEAT repeats
MPASLLIAIAITLGAGPKPGEEGSADFEKATALVKQLGDARFAVREAAGKQLIEMGGLAVPTLTAGTKSTDEEIRTRCSALLPKAKAAEWNRRADAYLARPDVKHDLPLLTEWDRFIGKPDLGSRKLYAEILRTNGELLEQAAIGSVEGRTALTARCREVLARVRGDRQQLPAGIGELASLFFVHRRAVNGPAEWSDSDHPSDLLGNPDLAEGIKAKDIGPAFRKVLVDWAEARPTDDVRCEQYFGLAVRDNPFPEAVPILSRWARSDKESRLNVRAVAFDALGKIGTREAKATLADLIEDKTLISKGNGNEMRLGDHALAALVASAGKKPEDFGLNSDLQVLFKTPGQSQPAPFAVYTFPTNDARNRGLEKWKAETAKKDK